MKGHATLWWESIQAERRIKNKPIIKKWDRMVAKMKGNFFPKYYQLSLYRHVENLKQRGMTMRKYTEEFYKVNMRARYVEDTAKKTTRYLNGLRIDIHDEINLLSPITMKEAQCAIKTEEKSLRKQNLGRGCGTKGKTQTTGIGKFLAQKNDVGTSNKWEQLEKKNEFRGGRTSQRGRGRGRGREHAYRCYKCNKLGHRSFESPENEKIGQRSAHIAQEEKGEVQPPVDENVAETRESLMMNKILLKPEKEEIKHVQKKGFVQDCLQVQGKMFPSGNRHWKH